MLSYNSSLERTFFGNPITKGGCMNITEEEREDEAGYPQSHRLSVLKSQPVLFVVVTLFLFLLDINILVW